MKNVNLKIFRSWFDKLATNGILGKRSIVPCFMVSMFLASSVSFAGTSKVDPLLRIMQAEPVQAISSMKAFGVKAMASGQAMAEVLVKAKCSTVSSSALQAERSNGSSTPCFAAEDVYEMINDMGGRARTIAGSIITASIPLDAIPELEALDDVVYIEAAKPMTPKMQYARATSGVADVQNGGGTGGTAYTGSGVIVGVVDSGIDCQHADFTGRILAYWDQNPSSGTTGVTEITNSTGMEYTGTELTDGSCTASPDGSDEGHGTHVTGIAAGGDSTFKGVAYGADIVAVQYYSLDADSNGVSLSSSLIDGVNYIFKKAQALQKPAVVNLSLGTSLGAHDDSSLLEEGLNSLLIESGTTEKQGRAIVNAAGNEQFVSDDPDAAYLSGIHAGINVTSNTPKAYEFLVRDGWSSWVLGHYDGVKLDLWLAANSSCTVKIDAYSLPSSTLNKTIAQKIAATVALTTGAISAGDATVTTTNGAGLSVSVAYESSNAQNSKPHALVTIGRTSTSISSSILTNYSFDLVLTGTCTGDAWLYPDQTLLVDFTKRLDGDTNTTNSHVYVAGDSSKTMTIPGTASGVITVGSFMDRDNWVDMNGATHYQTTYGTLNAFGGTANFYSLFTSVGPTAANTQKPDISAPGEPIISTMATTISPSSSLKGDSTHWKLQGSSMSAPHVTGAVALMLEKNGCLTPSTIKSKLQVTRSDVAGANLPDYYYGYGKLDALAAVNNVTAATCSPDNTADDTTDTTTAAASKTCSLNKRNKADVPSVFVALFGLICLLSVLHGAKKFKKSKFK